MIRFISMMGNIGVGKTTLASSLGRKLGLHYFHENVESNPLLKAYYDDPSNWAFETWEYFSGRRFFFQQAASVEGGITEKNILDNFVFAEVELDRKTVTSDQYESMKQETERMVRVCGAPDRTIYLRATPEVCLSRVKKRGRVAEANIDPRFIESLDKKYEALVGKNGTHPADIILDVNELDADQVLEAALSALSE